MRARRWLAFLLGGALLGLLGWVLAANLEWGERTVWVGWQGEARTNPYLAAQRFLDASGWRTECFHGMPMARLTGPGHQLLLLPARSRRLSPGQVEAIAGFVRNGGLLLAEGAWTEEAGTDGTQDPLFAAFGARLLPSRWWDAVQAKPAQERKAFQDAHHTLTVRLGADAGLQVRFAHAGTLEDRAGAEAAIGDETGTHVLVYRAGKGRAVLFTDMAWLRNDLVGAHDHAAFLQELTALSGRSSGHAALVIREEAPSLWEWLREKAPAALAAFAVLVLLALWRAMPRFGPRLPDPAKARRSLLEHLAACGRFQWRLRDGQALLRAARQAALDRLARVHPAWAALPPDALCRRLAEGLRIPEERVFRALRYERQPDSHGFTEAVETLDLIRKLP